MQSCVILRGSLRRQVAQGGPWHAPRKGRRVWDHVDNFAWSDLILDRSRKLVGLQSPAACATRSGGDPILTSRTTASSTPSPGHRARCSRPFVGGEPGYRRQALVSQVLFEGALAGSVTKRPLRERKKKKRNTNPAPSYPNSPTIPITLMPCPGRRPDFEVRLRGPRRRRQAPLFDNGN